MAREWRLPAHQCVPYKTLSLKTVYTRQTSPAQLPTNGMGIAKTNALMQQSNRLYSYQMLKQHSPKDIIPGIEDMENALARLLARPPALLSSNSSLRRKKKPEPMNLTQKPAEPVVPSP
jgi:hypothetical protein